jgi:aspartate carbamoyltransferase catalytic subunit
MHRLGGHVLGFSDVKNTRAGDFYQESIKDTVRMLEFYGDVLVMRHFQQGAPHEAAKWASIPVINAGDGWGEHPTQVLTDLYTILNEKGTLDGLNFLLIGDMRMRTMHSISYAMSQFDINAFYVSPPEMSLTDDFKKELNDLSLNFKEIEHVEQAIAEADVVYMEPVVQPDYTKARDERGANVGLTPDNYKITKELMRKAPKIRSFYIPYRAWMSFLLRSMIHGTRGIGSKLLMVWLLEWRYWHSSWVRWSSNIRFYRAPSIVHLYDPQLFISPDVSERVKECGLCNQT